MRKHVSISFEASQGYDAIPMPTVETVDCPNCHQRFPVPVEFMDWEKVAEQYKALYERRIKAALERIKELEMRLGYGTK